MLNMLFAKLFSRKYELLILGIIVIICTLGSKIITIDYWESINYNMASYHPWTPFIIIIWMGAAIGILVLRRIRAISLWIMFIAGLIYGLIMYWAMYINI